MSRIDKTYKDVHVGLKAWIQDVMDYQARHEFVIEEAKELQKLLDYIHVRIEPPRPPRFIRRGKSSIYIGDEII